MTLVLKAEIEIFKEVEGLRRWPSEKMTMTIVLSGDASIASDFNNHYFLLPRYLFAILFLKGFKRTGIRSDKSFVSMHCTLGFIKIHLGFI
jgi:hypothetical protein